MSIESVMPSNHLILCRPPLLLPSMFPRIKVFSNESALRIRWPEYWSSSFNISPSNEHPGLISFRMDWLDLLAVQGTLKSLLQHHSSKASIHKPKTLDEGLSYSWAKSNDVLKIAWIGLSLPLEKSLFLSLHIFIYMLNITISVRVLKIRQGLYKFPSKKF